MPSLIFTKKKKQCDLFPKQQKQELKEEIIQSPRASACNTKNTVKRNSFRVASKVCKKKNGQNWNTNIEGSNHNVVKNKWISFDT